MFKKKFYIEIILKIFNKPFIDNNGAKIYEWENNKNIRFRVIVDKLKREGLDVPLSPFDWQIIIGILIFNLIFNKTTTRF